MSKAARKLLILLPVLVLTFFFLKANYREEYRHAGTKRLFLFLLTVVILYIGFLWVLIRQRQESIWQGLVQSSFFVYIFMVLTLTGYFILFREISYHNWWEKMLRRIERGDHVNLELFQIFKIYKLTDKQILGNFIMLFPLGIYVPLLFKKLSGFIPAILVCFAVAVLIELLQLATSFRSVDVDDVLLNTTGGLLGVIVFKILMAFSGKETDVAPATV